MSRRENRKMSEEKRIFRIFPMPRPREGITIPIKPAEPPNVPLPNPISVGEPLELKLARFKRLLAVIAKELELGELIGRQYKRARDPVMKEVWHQYYLRQFQKIQEKWASAVTETKELVKEDGRKTLVIILQSFQEGLSKGNIIQLLDEAESVVTANQQRPAGCMAREG